MTEFPIYTPKGRSSYNLNFDLSKDKGINYKIEKERLSITEVAKKLCTQFSHVIQM